jgi:hypothetical protein
VNDVAPTLDLRFARDLGSASKLAQTLGAKGESR